jgi:hypothetical protein
VVLPAGVKLGLGLTHNDTHVAHGQIGCKVTTVQDGGMAAETGKIQVHDWIISVNGKDVSKDDKAIVVKVIKAAMASDEPVAMRFRRETVEGAAAESVAAAVSALPTPPPPGKSADHGTRGVAGQSVQGGVQGAVAATNRELEDSDALLACQAACTLVRRACLGAYRRKKRAMVAPDVLEEMAAAFETLCPADNS